jgi:hypothetical protein
MMYLERCDEDGGLHRGDAWIGRVTYSKTGRSVYYRGMLLARLSAPGFGGANHVDVDTGIGYWVTGVKQRGSNRHPQSGAGPIHIDDDVRAEYDALKRGNKT